MRSPLLTATGLMLAGSVVLAQTAVPPRPNGPAPGAPPMTGSPIPNQPAALPPPPTLDPANNKLDWWLVKWEKELSQIDALAARVVRTDVNNVNGSKDVYQGEVRFLKQVPASALASVTLTNVQNPQDNERILITPALACQFRSREKVVRIFQLPPPRADQGNDDNVLGILMGMKAAEAKRRYELKLVKDDQHWVYVEITPRFPADKQDFSRAQLVLSAKTLLPRRLWLKQPNDDETTWDLPEPAKTGKDSGVTRNDFVKPPTPTGWREEVIRPQEPAAAPANNGQGAPPRIVRPQH